jgi:hypothetical protein
LKEKKEFNRKVHEEKKGAIDKLLRALRVEKFLNIRTLPLSMLTKVTCVSVAIPSY